MDRRQRKTRKAIFDAFLFLLSKKNFNDVTVGEIIELADVGRATFYAHFETKDFLLKDLCAELFDHIFHAEPTENAHHVALFHCDGQSEDFSHLFRHITATFIETLKWWLENGMQETPERISEYFLQSV